MKSIAIMEGWAGGPRLSRRFRKDLAASGFNLVKDTSQADIIFAHSTACYMLPKIHKANLIILINPPYWPGESIVKRFFKMNRNENKLLLERYGFKHYLLTKIWEGIYIILKPSYTFSALKNQSHLDFLDGLKAQKVVFIHNKFDEFCSPKIKEIVNKHKNMSYVELSGYHADYYHNSKPYIDLIIKELRLG